jgi:hypothetical protein
VKRAWIWLLGVLGVLLSVIVWLALKLMQKDVEAKHARANATEANARRVIRLEEERLARLKQNAAANAGEIKRVESKISDKKSKLKKEFESQGLSGDEVAERFRRLRL